MPNYVVNRVGEALNAKPQSDQRQPRLLVGLA